MTNLKANVQFTCTEPGLSAEEKLQAIQSLYTEEEYDEVVYGKGISIFDTGMGIEDAEERNNTSLDPLYLEDGIDVELLCQVRQLHQGIKEPTQEEIDNYDKLNDVMTIDNDPRDRRKFFVFNTPGYRTIYHTLPGGGMVSSLVKSNSPYIRKVIWNEEGSFEEIIDNDKPDWLLEIESNEEKEKFNKKMEHKTKILWKAIKDSRAEYKKYYGLMEKYQAAGLTSYVILYKSKGDKAYKEYLKYSKAIDKVKELDTKKEHIKLEREANTLLRMFTEMQSKCPDKYIDSVTRDDIKNKYKKDGFEVTRYYLARLIKRLDDMIARKKYDEEHEATA